MKVLVCDPVSLKGVALLQQRPEFEVVVLPKRLPEADLLPLVSDAVALVDPGLTAISLEGTLGPQPGPASRHRRPARAVHEPASTTRLPHPAATPRPTRAMFPTKRAPEQSSTNSRAKNACTFL